MLDERLLLMVMLLNCDKTGPFAYGCFSVSKVTATAMNF